MQKSLANISKSLQPYKTQVGNAAVACAVAQFLSGSVVCWKIYNTGSTHNVDSVAFIGGIVNAVVTLENSYLLKDQPMFVTSLLALILNIIYTTVYAIYSTNKNKEVVKPLTVGVLIVAIMMGYVQWEDPKLLTYRYGLIATGLALAVLGAPLLDAQNMVKNKDASMIQMPMVASSAIVCALWMLYGIIILNEFLIIQNAAGFLLSITQVVLKLMYPSKRAHEEQTTSTQED